MINIKIENINNKIKLTVEGKGQNSDLIKEATFLISNSTEIYKACLDQFPDLSQLIVMLSAFKEMTSNGEHND